MQALSEAIQSLIKISEIELEQFLSKCFEKKFLKKQMLSEIDKIPNEVYFITKGLVRTLVIDADLNEKTVFFAQENNFISNYSAFLTNSKSPFGIEALEDTEVIVLPRQAIEWGYKNMKEGDKLGRLIAENYFIQFDKRILDQYTQTPKERYENITQVFPNINQLVPQHMIASYLGISSVHLSRLKKEK